MKWSNVCQAPGPAPVALQAFHEHLPPLTLHARPSLQVDEIYHDESLGTLINIALVRLIMVGYRQVNYLSTGRIWGWGNGRGASASEPAVV